MKKSKNEKLKDKKGDNNLLDEQWNISNLKQKMTKQNMIIFLVISIIIVLIFFQYQYERQQQAGISDNTIDEDEDYYQILGLEPNADLTTIRKQYKKLAKLWHPDKHPDCQNCKEIFNKLTNAHDALTKDFDDRKKTKSIFKANPYIITSKNYHRLVEQSTDLWIILAYEKSKNDKYLEYVSNIFDDITIKHKSIIKFGVIDIIKEESLMPFLPFKLQTFPCIFTHLIGEHSEILDNMEYLSPKSLDAFIEKSYVTKVKLIETSGIIEYNNNKGKEKEIPDNLNIKDMDTSFFILSPRNYIDLVVKDFGKTYESNCKVFQNDLGYFDEAIKVFDANNSNRVFISYYQINKEKHKLINVIQPIPIKFDKNEKMSSDLFNAFQIGKKINVPKIYKNNYKKHCQTKETEKNNENDQIETQIDLCIIELNLGLIETDDLKEGFFTSVIQNFNNELNNIQKRFTKYDNYKINIQFGQADLKKHKNLKQLFDDYYIKNQMALIPKDNSKVFFIINETQERFLFKVFIDGKNIIEYFNKISNPEIYDDMEFSFLFLSDYGIKGPHNLFNELKIFSLIQIASMAFSTQLQLSHIIMYFLLFLTELYLFKIDSNKSSWHIFIAFCMSILGYAVYYTIGFLIS